MWIMDWAVSVLVSMSPNSRWPCRYTSTYVHENQEQFQQLFFYLLHCLRFHFHDKGLFVLSGNDAFDSAFLTAFLCDSMVFLADGIVWPKYWMTLLYKSIVPAARKKMVIHIGCLSCGRISEETQLCIQSGCIPVPSCL